MTGRFDRRDALIAAAVCAITLGLYARTIGFDFVNIDDSLQLTKNTLVQQGLTPEGVRYAFTTVDDGNYMPLTWLSHLVVVEFAGMRAGVHHGVNAALHALAAALLYLLLRGMTGARGCSAVAALLFALHPLRAESVAWVSERKDVLSAVFFMLTLLAYTAYTRKRSPARYAAVAALFALGLLSKPMLVTLPVVMLLLDAWPLGRLSDPRPRAALLRLVLEKSPLFAISALAAAGAVWGQRVAGSLRSVETTGIAERAFTALAGYGTYLVQTMWPARLAVFYPMPAASELALRAALGAALLAGITLLVIRFRKDRPYLVVGWLWFLAVLLPVTGLVQAGAQAHADRYTYLPHIGLFVALVWGVDEALRRATNGARWRAGLAAAACAACAILSWRQIGYWRDSATLFGHALAVTPDNWFTHGNYAAAMNDLGRYEEAVHHGRQAIALGEPWYGDFFNLGTALLALRRPQEAAQALETAARLRPDHDRTWYELGRARLAMAEPYRAIEAFEKALEFDPADKAARVNLAIALAMSGQDRKARDVFRSLLEVWPANPDALYNFGVLEVRGGRFDAGRSHLERLVELHPGHADAWYYLAAIEACQGRPDEALEALRKAIALDRSLAQSWREDDLFLPLRRTGAEP